MRITTGTIDSNILLRRLVQDVPAQYAAARELLGSGTFFVPDIALIETIFVLGRHYGLSRAEQKEAIVGILAQPTLDSSEEVFASALTLYVGHPELSFEDCYLVALSEHDGRAPLWTFDKKLANQTSARLVAASSS